MNEQIDQQKEEQRTEVESANNELSKVYEFNLFKDDFAIIEGFLKVPEQVNSKRRFKRLRHESPGQVFVELYPSTRFTSIPVGVFSQDAKAAAWADVTLIWFWKYLTRTGILFPSQSRLNYPTLGSLQERFTDQEGLKHALNVLQQLESNILQEGLLRVPCKAKPVNPPGRPNGKLIETLNSIIEKLDSIGTIAAALLERSQETSTESEKYPEDK